MLRWSPDELEEAGKMSLILRMQCPILPEDAYGIVYRLVSMTLPRSVWDEDNGLWRGNNDCFDRDDEMLSVPNATKDKIETRMADFERLDRMLMMGPRDSSSDRIDEYTDFLSGRHLEGESANLSDPGSRLFDPVQSAKENFEIPHDNLDAASIMRDLSSLEGPLFLKVVEDMFLEADFSMFVHQDIFG